MSENYKKLTRKELKGKLDNGNSFLLINVLSPSSFDALHIPTSVNIDISQPDFLDKIEQMSGSDKNKEIVVYCSSFTCQASPSAARKLTEAGYTNVYDFEGGLADWKDAGYKLKGVMAGN